ncbi:MAG: hypothetical protein KKE16_01080 [Firmicutes bacterium]|nr:hypothetical protein [Bacillota bacterium]
MRKIERGLYQDKNGKDYLLKLKEESKRIIQLDLQTGFVSEFPFGTYREARINFQAWLKNSELRLPKQFVINTENNCIEILMDEIQQLSLPIPKDLTRLEKYIFYHNQTYMTLGEFDNNNIPEINLQFLKDLNKQNRIRMNQLSPRRKKVMNLNSIGLFKPMEVEQHA